MVYYGQQWADGANRQSKRRRVCLFSLSALLLSCKCR